MANTKSILTNEAYKKRYGVDNPNIELIQELTDKAPVLPLDIEWHHIGHLQSNKVKAAVEYSDLIHAVDSIKLARRIDRIAGESGKVQKILIQANVSGEESKFGLNLDEIEAIMPEILSLENVDCRGFMTMTPASAESDERKAIFKELSVFRDRISHELSTDFPELSMGMTSDYKEAIAAGATIIRIGTAIFGARNYE